MPTIRFKTKLFTIGTWTILKLPREASAKLPSRGQTMVRGTINGTPFQTPLEPDGYGSHWFRVEKNLQEAANARAGDSVTLEIESTKEWPEPTVPADLEAALSANAPVRALWAKITPMARWDWIRWVRATNKQETRQRRIDVAISKMEHGERRPCCFNRTACTVPYVSEKGALLEPTTVAAPAHRGA